MAVADKGTSGGKRVWGGENHGHTSGVARHRGRDPTRPVAYPDNGCLLTDDVGDYLVAILTNGRVTEDKVGPHDDFLGEFPYLGPPHENRTEA
jgi:hypothetical protein